MVDYKTLYALLFNAMTDALEQIDAQNYGAASETLIAAPQAGAKQQKSADSRRFHRAAI